jgi:hypothetical protein
LSYETEEWTQAYVRFSKRGKILNTLTRLMIPTCIPELIVLSVLFPSLALSITFPLLVIPLMMLFLATTLFSMAKTKLCQVSFQRGYLFIKLPKIDILYTKPRDVKLMHQNLLQVRSRFNSFSLQFENNEQCRSLFTKLQRFGS